MLHCGLSRHGHQITKRGCRAGAHKKHVIRPIMLTRQVNGVLPEQEVLPEPFTSAEQDADQ